MMLCIRHIHHASNCKYSFSATTLIGQREIKKWLIKRWADDRTDLPSELREILINDSEMNESVASIADEEIDQVWLELLIGSS
jgi:hypothetical protein